MLSRRVLSLSTRRLTNVRFYSNEGAVGSTRTDGKGDAFTKREKAQEDFFIKKHEREQLAKLKAELEAHKKELEELEKKINSH